MEPREPRRELCAPASGHGVHPELCDHYAQHRPAQRERQEEDDKGGRLLTQLDSGLRGEVRGHDNLSVGFGGMILHGWLTGPEVCELRTYLQQSAWKVAQSETFDGGVRDVVRHFLIILKTAEKRGVGILMRAHGD